MTGESTHSSSGAEEERELPHVREGGWEEEREGEREQEEGEGEARRDQGEPRKLGKLVPTITRLVGNNRVYRWYGCWLVITYQERGLLIHTPPWHEGPPSVRWMRSNI